MSRFSEETKKTVREMLLEHWGKENQISSADINDVIEVDEHDTRSGTRKLIRNRLLEDDLPVASTNEGYYLIETQEELEAELASINRRVAKIMQRRKKVAESAAKHNEEIDLTEVDFV